MIHTRSFRYYYIIYVICKKNYKIYIIQEKYYTGVLLSGMYAPRCALEPAAGCSARRP